MWKNIIVLLAVSTVGHAATPQDAVDTAVAASIHQQMQNSLTQSYMMISPVARAQDLLQAYEALRKEKTSAKVFFQLVDGSALYNVIEMTLMSNSTLILFRLNTPQGIRFQLVKVEDILNINY